MFDDRGSAQCYHVVMETSLKALDLIKVLALREQITFWPNLP